MLFNGLPILNSMRKLSNGFFTWIPLCVVIIGLTGLIYFSIQQTIRMSLNDPQIQIAEDTATALNAGVSIAAVVGSDHVNMAQSLKTWIVIYDKAKKPVAGSGILGGILPVPPSGVFDATEYSAGTLFKENTVTWQPQKNVRQAIVVIPTDKGYVIVGRSMREAEKRETKLFSILALAAGCLLIISLLVHLVFRFIRK